MISSVNASSLAQIYRSQGSDYSTLIAQIATGKQINKPSDNFVGYTRAAGISNAIESYKDINTNLAELREPAQLASDVGNGIFEDLTRMKELADLYSASSDDSEKTTYSNEFSALTTRITDTISKNKYNGSTIYSTGTLASAEINPDDSTLKLSLDFVASDIADVSGFALGSTTAANVQDQLDKASSFAVKADGYLTLIDRQKKLNENLISNKEDTYKAIVDLDEVKAIAKSTDLQIRQQATIAMIAQANSMAGNVSRLYQ